MPLKIASDGSAKMCRDKGWSAGTILEGDEGGGPDRIIITAIGESNVLARKVSANGKPHDYGYESLWALDCRKWKEV